MGLDYSQGVVPKQEPGQGVWFDLGEDRWVELDYRQGVGLQ